MTKYAGNIFWEKTCKSFRESVMSVLMVSVVMVCVHCVCLPADAVAASQCWRLGGSWAVRP